MAGVCLHRSAMYTRSIDSNLESGRYISSVGRASRFLSLLPLGASVHQMPFYSRMYLNLLIGRVVHVTSGRLHEQQISPRNECPQTLLSRLDRLDRFPESPSIPSRELFDRSHLS